MDTTKYKVGQAPWEKKPPTSFAVGSAPWEKPTAPVQPVIPEKTLGWLPTGNPREVGQGIYDTLVDPVLHPIDKIVKPAIKVAGSALAAPVDIIRGGFGYAPMRSDDPNAMTTIQSDFAQNYNKVANLEMDPAEAAIQAFGDTSAALTVLGIKPTKELITEVSTAIMNSAKRTATRVVENVTERLAGKTSAQILATAESKVPTLSVDEQAQWYKNKSTIAKQASADMAAKGKAASEASLAQAKENIIKAEQNLGKMTTETAIAQKEPVQKLFRDSGKKYVELSGEAADGSPALKKTMAADDLADAIDSKFEHNPEVGNSLKNDLGLTEPKPQIDVESGLPTIDAAPPVQTWTNQQILDKAREIMRRVSASSKAGNKVYTPAEYQAMQKYSFLMEQLGENGVDMTKANQFWKEWVPVRNRLMTEVRPFDEGNTKSMKFSSTVRKAEAPANTATQMASKLDAQNFISQVETRLKLPKGSLGAEVRKAVAGAEKAKLAKLDVEKMAKEIQAQIKADKVAALKTMSEAAYDAKRLGMVRARIKKYLIWAGVYAVARVTGADKALLNVAASAL